MVQVNFFSLLLLVSFSLPYLTISFFLLPCFAEDMLEYVFLLVSNNRPKDQIASDLEAFFGLFLFLPSDSNYLPASRFLLSFFFQDSPAASQSFTEWLWELLKPYANGKRPEGLCVCALLFFFHPISNLSPSVISDEQEKEEARKREHEREEREKERQREKEREREREREREKERERRDREDRERRQREREERERRDREDRERRDRERKERAEKEKEKEREREKERREREEREREQPETERKEREAAKAKEQKEELPALEVWFFSVRLFFDVVFLTVSFDSLLIRNL
jgi:hypothetical protein